MSPRFGISMLIREIRLPRRSRKEAGAIYGSLSENCYHIVLRENSSEVREIVFKDGRFPFRLLWNG